MDRITEATIFLESFKKKSSLDFLFPFLLNNYTNAVCHYFPGPTPLRDVIEKKTEDLLASVFDELLTINAEDLFPWFHKKSRSYKPTDPIWFPEFIKAYQHYKHECKLENRYRMLRPYLHGKSYCDVGCGGGDLVAHLLTNHSEFESAAGIDILDWRSPKVKQLIDFQMLDFTKASISSRMTYDTLTCLAVLHHTGNSPESMVNFLSNVKTAMNPGAVLIIEEDVILPSNQHKTYPGLEDQLSTLFSQQDYLLEFLSFSSEEQKDIIVSIDFLANCLSVGVPEMPFPCGFQTLDSWLEIFVKSGLKVREVRIQGFVKNNFNQSFHVFFILENS